MLPTINNGNCTEWSAIWSEIKRVITKSHDREAGMRFVITSLISDQNCMTRSAISTFILKSTSGYASLFTKYVPKLAPSCHIATCEQNGRDIKSRLATQPYCNTVEYGYVSLRMRFFSQNFGTIKRILSGSLSPSHREGPGIEDDEAAAVTNQAKKLRISVVVSGSLDSIIAFTRSLVGPVPLSERSIAMTTMRFVLY